MSSGKALSLKRINKDMKEITKSPNEGIGIISLNNDPMKYIVNIRLMAGIYEGYCIQLLLTFSENYPSKPPKILIYPGQAIDGQYHHHIFPDSSKDENNLHFKKFCFDLLENDFMSTSAENTGWNPSYSISSLLLQVQNFLSDPDMPKNHLPNKSKIEELMKSMQNYQREFTLNEENGEIKKIIHTWKAPYPEMYFKKDDNKNIDGNISNDSNIEQEENIKKIKEIKDNLTCFMLKLNYIDDPEIMLGYPVIKCEGLGKNKIELYPIPELLTYEGFMAQIGKESSKLDYYFDTTFKSANNKYYNYWIPIYINKNHYEKNRTTILNSFSVIKFGVKGIKEYDFQVEQIFEILPIILNKMIIGIFNGKSSVSSAFIICYFQFILLFMKLTEEFDYEYIKYLNHKLNLIHKNKYNVNKSIIPDIGDFLILLLFCNRNTHREVMKKMWYCIYEEFFARQIYWIFRDKNSDFLGDLLLYKRYTSDYIKRNNELFKKTITLNILMKKNVLFKNLVINNEQLLSLNYKIVVQYFKDKGDYNKFLDIVCSDEKCGKNNSKTDIIKKMDVNFKSLMGECTQQTQEKFYDLYSSQKRILEDILRYIYQSQKGNKLLMITALAGKKIEEKGFIKKLENNYGVYLDTDDFIKEIKKIEEISSYKKCIEYIGCEFRKNDTDIEILVKSYKKAKQMKYI